MARYILGRLAQALVALWVVVTVTFVLMHAVPGDPFASLKTPAAVRQLLQARYGLDLPLPRQYLIYLGNVARGRLGWSLLDPQRTVGGIIRAGLPVSAELGAEALVWSLGLGVALGLAAALRPTGAWGWATAAASLLGLALPNFVLAVLSDYVFAVRAAALPVAGWGSPAQSVLPALALGALPLALVARMTAAQAAEVLAADHVRAARAKGLTWAQVLRRHVLRNALLPVLTLLGPLVAATLTGSFVIESVFGVPGLGSAFVSSILDRDYPLILGLTIFYAALLLLLHLLVDLAYGAADPRVRLAARGG